jgi:hypothetical protein
MRPAGVSRQAAIRSVRNLAPAARPPHSLPEWHGPRHRFVPSTRWLLSPKALSGPTCSPCAYAFPHHSESTASEVSLHWADRWRQSLKVVPLARSYELQELQTGCSLLEGTLEFSCDQQGRGRPMRSRERLRLREHINNSVGHTVHNQYMILHFHVHVVTQFRYLR